MSSDLAGVFLLTLVAAINPTLLATTTITLLQPHAERLMLGYWLGAIITSVTLGLLIAFDLKGSGPVSTTRKTLSPLADIALGLTALTLAWVLDNRHGRRAGERQRRDKEPPRWQQALRKGNRDDHLSDRRAPAAEPTLSSASPSSVPHCWSKESSGW